MNMNKTNKGNRIYKKAVSILGTAFFIGAFAMTCRIETETIMSPTYILEAKVTENVHKGNKWIIKVNCEDGEIRTYFADRPEKLLTKVTLKMNNKGTLAVKDDEIVDRIK